MRIRKYQVRLTDEESETATREASDRGDAAAQYVEARESDAGVCHSLDEAVEVEVTGEDGVASRWLVTSERSIEYRARLVTS